MKRLCFFEMFGGFEAEGLETAERFAGVVDEDARLAVGIIDEWLSFVRVHKVKDKPSCNGCVVGNAELEYFHDGICQRADLVDEVHWNQMTDA